MQHIKIMIFILAFHSLWASANDGLTFKCEFKTSFSTKAWPDEKINVQKGKGFSEPLYFTEIKSNNQHAKMIGNAGTASVYVIMDSEKIHLIELTPALNIVVTTIFYNEKIENKNREFKAVMSRHIDFANPIISISQNYGHCTLHQ